MSDFARITVRVSEKMKRQMDSTRDTNWSEIIRRELKKYLIRDIGEIKLRNKIRELLGEGKLSVLKALFLFGQYVGKVDLNKNLEKIQAVDYENTRIELDNVLDHIGIEHPYSKIGDNSNFCDVLLEIYLEEGIIDILGSQVQKNFQESEMRDELAIGLRVLSYYLEGRHDDANIRMTAHILEIIFSYFYDNPLRIIEELNRLGILYSYLTNTKAYYHLDYYIPIYSYKLLDEIQLKPYEYSLTGPFNFDRNLFEEIMSEERNRELLRFLQGFDNGFKEHELDVLIKDYNYRKGEGVFKTTMRNLIEKGLITPNYSPHRSRAGKRKSSPAIVSYTVSPRIREIFIQSVFRKTSESYEKKGELQILIDLYEKYS